MQKVCLYDKGRISELVQTSKLITDKPCFLFDIIINNFLPVAVLQVTGDLTPDATGYYYEAGIYNEHSYYVRLDGKYFIWFYTPYCWYITDTAVGYLDTIDWVGSESLIGDYYPEGDAVGLATVGNCYQADYIRIYDGFSIDGICKFYLTGTEKTSYLMHFKKPVFMAEGVFVFMSIAGLTCLITYKLAKESEV